MDNNKDKTKISSSFITPDGLRKVLQSIKNFNELHTKKNYGYEDIEGSQYSGTIENFGSELLIETRKLLMNRPSLKSIFFKNSFDFYFDIQYSNLISTYDQQNTLVAVLRKDVLLSNKEYRIKFEECKNKYILRSESWSDPNVYRDHFIYTKTPPKLIISDKNNINNVEEIDLYVDDGYKKPTEYYYHINPLTENFIDIYDNENNILITKPLTDDMFGTPMVWICVDILNTLPDIEFKNNKIDDNSNYLSIGTDGHETSRLYPGVFTPLNKSIFHDMYIKATFEEYNISDSIDKISIILDNGLETLENEIEFDSSHIKISLSDEVKWSINNEDPENVFAYVSFDEFVQNIPNENKTQLISAFIISFNDKYLYPLEITCGNAVTGIHIDGSSEYRENGIYKKNGVIHDLGDFDGLPVYFKYLLDRTIHRSHIELYSIRDDLNNRNQKSTDKQVSALILDSGIPKNETDEFLKYLDVVIKYDMSLTPGEYITSGEIISKYNTLSEITFIDEDTLGNINIPGQEKLPKFIYHGGRVFSLSTIDNLDSELEFGRVYMLSNDDSVYENNSITDNPKPDRTVARICDIPTSFVQLLKIEGVSPTVIIDEKYIRNETSYDSKEKYVLWNDKTSRIVMNIDESGNNHLIFPENTNLDEVADPLTLKKVYMSNLNPCLDLNEDINDYHFNIHSGGQGYSIGDMFNHVLCGISIIGTVTNVDINGTVTDFTILSFDDYVQINKNNLSGKITLCKTTAINGTGNGLILSLELSDDIMNRWEVVEGDPFEDISAFKFDKYGNIWVWCYDTINKTWIQNNQLTGPKVEENEYDDFDTSNKRLLSDVFIRNILLTHYRTTGFPSARYFKSIGNYEITSSSNISSSLDVNSDRDLSGEIIGQNRQDYLYILSESERDTLDITLICKYFQLINIMNKYVLPRFHKMNLEMYHNKTNMIEFGYDNNTTQPIPFIFNPIKDVITSYDNIGLDVYKLKDKHEFTFYDMIRQYNDKANILNLDTGILDRNIYTYDEKNKTPYMLSIEESIRFYNRNELLEYISDNFGENTYPIKFENTLYEFTDDMLRDYIIQNSYDSPIYKKNDLYLLRKKGEQVIEESENGDIKGLGEQPKGLYVEVSATIVDSKVSINGKDYESDIAYFFYVDEEMDSDYLKDFRIIDDGGFDISNNSILICKNKKFIFYKDRWTCIN